MQNIAVGHSGDVRIKDYRYVQITNKFISTDIQLKVVCNLTVSCLSAHVNVKQKNKYLAYNMKIVMPSSNKRLRTT